MADKDTLPIRGIPYFAIVDGSGVAVGGSLTMAELRRRGMEPICEVDSSGSASGTSIAALQRRGISYFCPVDESGLAADATTSTTLRQRGILPLCKVSSVGVAQSGSLTITQLARRGIGFFCPLDESGNEVSVTGTIIAGGGSYVWTGQDAGLVVGETASLAADAGSYLWTGDDMTALRDIFVTAEAGSYAWTGQDATLTASGGGLGLQTDLTAFWEFENTGWTDATGNGTTLTAVGSPTSVTGKVGNAASLGNSANALTAASNTNISAGGGSFSAAVWVNSASVPGQTTAIFNKDLNTFGNREWGFGSTFSGTNRWSCLVSNTSTTTFTAVAASGSGDFSTGWHHLVMTYDSGSKAVVLYLDGSATGTGATLTGTLNSSASATLNFGRMGAGTPIGSNPILVDQAGFWKGRVLSAADVTALYNGGSGLSYAAMA